MAQKDLVLEALKLNNYEELFRDIPEEVRSGIDSIGKGMTELELLRESDKIASLNKSHMDIFLGLGAYQRFIPSSINNVVMRNEFITSYTPYQAEISQGMLQALFEYQSLISDLSGMDVTNSSMYDGPTALGEAVRMAHRVNGKTRVILPSNTRKSHLQVLHTYIDGLGISVEYYGVNDDGTIDLESIKNLIDGDLCAIVTYNPSNFGTIDPGVTSIVEIKGDALHIAYFDPISVSILKAPGEYDADIAVGEGQAMGVPLYYGGPYLGLFSFKNKYVRKSPGRLIGKTTDVSGNDAYVMTLQTREQHIRRDRATSNICTNQALLAVAASAYLSILGEKGLKWAATKSMNNVSAALKALEKISYVKQFKWKNPFFTDFIVDVGEMSGKLSPYLQRNNILGGMRTSEILNAVERKKNDAVFFAATEMITEEQIDHLVKVMELIQ